jgi:hypothetical protein
MWSVLRVRTESLTTPLKEMQTHGMEYNLGKLESQGQENTLKFFSFKRNKFSNCRKSKLIDESRKSSNYCFLYTINLCRYTDLEIGIKLAIDR